MDEYGVWSPNTSSSLSNDLYIQSNTGNGCPTTHSDSAVNFTITLKNKMIEGYFYCEVGIIKGTVCNNIAPH